MEINRRTLLTTALAAPFFLASKKSAAASAVSYITTGRTGTNNDFTYFAYFLDKSGKILSSLPLEGRSHGTTVNRIGDKAVIFCRRPGSFARSLDLKQPNQGMLFKSPQSRHFYGHGVFSKNSRLLFATENNFAGETGVLGIYDVQNKFQRLGEINCGGIGPHDIVLSEDGRTLIVANGGIATHPDYPRKKLNLPDMRPSIAFIDIKSGEIQQTLSLPKSLHQVSLRHLAVAKTGTIWIGGQYQGAKTDTVPVIFKILKNSQHIIPISTPQTPIPQSTHYIGSVATNRLGTDIALSAPRSDKIFVYRESENRWVDVIRREDASGIAAHKEGFLITSGTGTIQTPGTVVTIPEIRWDNHITAL